MAKHGVNGVDIETLIGKAAVGQILAERPEQASGLPNMAFTSPDFLEAERRLLFSRTWVFAGFASDLPEPGDAVPVNPFGVPMVLARDRDGGIRCFQNVCRHRGVQLLGEACRGLSHLTCPYHGWSYRLDGTNVNRPHYAGPDQHQGDEKLTLFPVRWQQSWDLIFVNLDGNAPPFAEHIKPFTDRLAGYDLDALKPMGVLPWEFDANCKLVQENYIEPYHVSSVHPRLGDWTPLAAHKFGFDGACCHNSATFDQADDGRGGGLPLIPGLTEEQKHLGVYLHLFPNVDVGVWPDHVHVLVVWPDAPDRTREEIRFYTAPEALEPQHEAARQAIFDGWRELNGEDIDVVERLQKGRACPAYDGGVLTPYWDTVTHHFSRLVVEAMQP